ncbi:GGDEF domain-containing protein [Bacillus salipaludis]|uniref:GGDEF domain-containing protein n=1 Tax=Bacillus salipaludis TaxID=2547811 RepID=A0A4R5VRL4_9BACI|nr:GGDEF domain-containing protein [Bacillus salipaludis]TDK61056.1 GGDEF domain-containing protein [Bacillus salipaludis]
MKCTGRVSILAFIIVSYLIGLYIHGSAFTRLDLVLIPVLSLFAWYSGKQYDLVKFHSEKDFLTKIYNRRYTEKIFPKLKAKMERLNKSMAVFLLDVNNFKEINDSLGHDTGDVVLIMLTELLAKTLNKSEVLFRWGGDEFLIIAPNTNQIEAEKIRGKIETCLLNSERNTYHIAVSIGYSIYPDQAKRFEEAVMLADQQMYKTKLEKKCNGFVPVS